MNICTTEFDVVCFCRSESRRGDEVVKQGTFFDSDHGEEEMYSIRSSYIRCRSNFIFDVQSRVFAVRFCHEAY